LKKSFCQILTMLAVFDTFFVISAIIAFSLPLISDYWNMVISPTLFPYLMPLVQISLNGSIWSVVSVAWERFVSIVYPSTKFSSLSGEFYIIPVIIISFFWNIPRFFELYTCTREANVTTEVHLWRNGVVNISHIKELMNITEICPTEMRKSYAYSRDYILTANFIMMMLVPLVLISIMNLLLYLTIRKSSTRIRVTSRQRRDQKVAMLLITVVVVFIGCNMIRICINTYEVFHLAYFGDLTLEWPTWAKVLTSISHLFLVLNSSTNIIIYCWKDDKFRLVLFRMLKLYRPMEQSPSPCSTPIQGNTRTMMNEDVKSMMTTILSNSVKIEDVVHKGNKNHSIV